jgi:hypothetical protein
VAEHEFHVGLTVAPRAVAWPFGRLTITAADLTVASASGRWIKPLRFPRDEVALELTKRFKLRQIRLRSCGGGGHPIRVEMPFGSARIVAALESAGYRVDDSCL